MRQLIVTLPDNWPKNKHFHTATMFNCDKCEFHTPDVALYLKHAQEHIFSEEIPDRDLTTAP